MDTNMNEILASNDDLADITDYIAANEEDV